MPASGKTMETKGDRPMVVVAGQMPPPVGGQNLNVKRVFELLKTDENFHPVHWDFRFATNSQNFGKVSFSKIWELGAVMGRLLKIRQKGPIHGVLYPVGGPHTVPLVRDLMIVPLALLLSNNVYLHFRAAGLKGYLEQCHPLMRKAVRAVYSRASKGVVLAEFGKEDPEAAGLDRIYLLPNAIEDVSAGAISRQSQDEIRILSVGHLCREKGTPELIKAFGELAKTNPRIHLDLVGEPAREFSHEELKALCDESPGKERIHLHGLRQGADLHEHYREASVFVFPSVAPYESFGMVLIEAMMWGLPLIVSEWRANVGVAGGENLGGMSYSVDRHEEALKSTMEKMLGQRENWAEMGRVNRQYFENNYTIAHLKKNLNNLFKGTKNDNCL